MGHSEVCVRPEITSVVDGGIVAAVAGCDGKCGALTMEVEDVLLEEEECLDQLGEVSLCRSAYCK